MVGLLDGIEQQDQSLSRLECLDVAARSEEELTSTFDSSFTEPACNELLQERQEYDNA